MSTPNLPLPSSDSPALTLAHPTPIELTNISINTAKSWSDTLPLPTYLQEGDFLATVPLACNGGMKTWVLVDADEKPGKRRVFSSCETFRKRGIVNSGGGDVRDVVVYGIASVFCHPEYRGYGYAKRMMIELAKKLKILQEDEREVVGSVLYSDIGGRYYQDLGWGASVANMHLEFTPIDTEAEVNTLFAVKELYEQDISALCERDEALLRRAMAKSTSSRCKRVAILPNADHMHWHLAKELYACNHLFQKIPHIKGAIAGPPGHQVWALWKHRYYSQPSSSPSTPSSNVLYILRLVMELDETSSRLSEDESKSLEGPVYIQQKEYLKAVLVAALNEARVWKLDRVELWDPTSLVRRMVAEMGLGGRFVEREKESVACAMWYGEGKGDGEETNWVGNEYYAWC